MAYTPARGDALLIPFNDVLHLFAILNDPCPDGMCLMVMVSSIKQGKKYDGACVLDKGDHDFIKHPSYVVYRLASCVAAKHISAMVANQSFRERGRFSDSVFEKILDGLFKSDDTRPYIIKYAEKLDL